MFGVLQAEMPRWCTRRACLGAALAVGLAWLGGCTGTNEIFSSAPPAGPQQPAATVGTGQVKVGLILPMSAAGNAGGVAQSMKNAAEMALVEFSSPNIQLLVKDDGGSAGGAQTAARQALEEGAEIILGPLFAHSVGAVGQVARQRGVPVIAFSTDATVASRGIYLLSFLPESDVDRIIDYAVSQGKRSFAAMIPENPYGSVAEAAFKQAVARKNARMVALERYPQGGGPQLQGPARNVAQAARNADALFIPDSADALPGVVQALCRGRSAAAARAASRHRPLERLARLRRRLAARRLVRRRRFHVPEFRRALSQPLRAGAGARGDAGL